jgi:hypothetical protein
MEMGEMAETNGEMDTTPLSCDGCHAVNIVGNITACDNMIYNNN